MSRYFMGIDVGTTGGRACIFDDEGNMAGQSYKEYKCHYPQPSWVEQYSAELLEVLFETSREAITASGLQAAQVESVALSMQGPVTCLLDENFELLTPLIGWQDLRGLPHFGEAIERLKDPAEYYGVTGGPLAPANPIGKVMWLQKEMPEAWEKATYISGGLEYFNKQFGSDEFVTDPSIASRSMMMDINNNCFSKEMLARLGCDVEKYAQILPCGTVIGRIKGEIAQQTGLEEGTPLVMGALDQNTATLGMGMIHQGQAGFTLGTAGLVTAITETSMRDKDAQLIVKPNASVGNYTMEGVSFASASAYKWYRDTLCRSEIDAGDKLGIDTYDIMNQLARKSKPGANGVTFLNFLQGAAGVISNFGAKGLFNGITFSTTKGDMTRAVMEGIIYEAKNMTDAITGLGIEINEMRVSGGGTKSRTWCQIQADIFNRPVILLQCSELSALGAAMLAGIGVGAFKDIEEAVDKCVHIKKEYTPNKETQEAYQAAYQQYMDCYEGMSKGNAWK